MSYCGLLRIICHIVVVDDHISYCGCLEVYVAMWLLIICQILVFENNM